MIPLLQCRSRKRDHSYAVSEGKPIGTREKEVKQTDNRQTKYKNDLTSASISAIFSRIPIFKIFRLYGRYNMSKKVNFSPHGNNGAGY